MKTALLLSGLPRNVKDGYSQYFEHIIKKYNADVYLHFWEDADFESVLKIYDPKKYISTTPFSFSEYKIGVKSPNDPLARPIFPYDVAGNYTALPMFYGWQSVYSLLDGNYDCIIKSRYDIGWESPIDLKKFDLSKINISNMHWQNSEIIDDNIFITNQILADKILSDVFNFFVHQIKRDGVIYTPEKNLTNILIERDLYQFVYKSNELPFKLLREFKVWY